MEKDKITSYPTVFWTNMGPLWEQETKLIELSRHTESEDNLK
jgi:hypothetical protein